MKPYAGSMKRRLVCRACGQQFNTAKALTAHGKQMHILTGEARRRNISYRRKRMEELNAEVRLHKD